MAGIKDKTVTVESLAILHEYDKNNYMTKTNPVCSGTFSMNRKVNSDIGNYSTTLGFNVTASGQYSQAEGIGTTASNTGAHSEGTHTVASGLYSHAEGSYTIAAGAYQHVQGRYNVEDTSHKYAHIIGNGSAESRSNAHTVDWNGNGCFAGDVYVGGASKENGIKLVKSANVVSVEYGDELPEAGIVGRIFFKRLVE